MRRWWGHFKKYSGSSVEVWRSSGEAGRRPERKSFILSLNLQILNQTIHDSLCSPPQFSWEPPHYVAVYSRNFLRLKVKGCLKGEVSKAGKLKNTKIIKNEK